MVAPDPQIPVQGTDGLWTQPDEPSTAALPVKYGGGSPIGIQVDVGALRICRVVLQVGDLGLPGAGAREHPQEGVVPSVVE